MASEDSPGPVAAEEPAPDPLALVPAALRPAFSRQGFARLTAVQEAVLSADLDARDLRISSQTGSGKTVALGLALVPTLEATDADRAGPLAVVLAPTRELATQVRKELESLYADLAGVKVVSVTGGTDPIREAKLLARRPMVLVGTPGRLLDHLTRGAVDLSDVRHAVLDEADQMLDLGFRDELDAILEALPETRHLHMVSATFARDVLRFAEQYQKEVLPIEGTRLGAANEDIEYVAHLVLPHERHAALVNLLLLDLARSGGSWLVFVRRRADAAELAELLAEDGFTAMPFSGELSQVQRDRALTAFRQGLVKVLVATDVAARGIDVQGISTVVHYDLPTDRETFTHRSGRTGRAGQKGHARLLVPPSAERRIRRILAEAEVDASWETVPDRARIEKAAIKRSRRALHARLEAADDLAAKQLEYAGTLLERFDAATVVAVLLDMARGDLPREPLQIRDLETRGEGRRGPAGRSGPRFEDGHRPRGRWPRGGARGRGGRGRGPRRPRFGGRGDRD